MNCQRTKDLIVIGIYGRLTKSQQEELKAHLQVCPNCASRYEKSALLMNLRKQDKDIPEPDLKRSWEVISSRILKRKQSSGVKNLRKWALAACSLLIVFILGYFAGKRILNPGPTSISAAVDIEADYSFSSYADNLNPVLVNFLNRNEVETPEALRILEQKLISDMLTRTRLLKSLASGSEDMVLMELLQDLEIILMSLKNMNPEDLDSARHLARMIQEKKISLRLQELSSTRSTI